MTVAAGGLVLDLDGTVVDSEPLVDAGWTTLLTRHLGKAPPAVETLTGWSFSSRYRWALQYGGLPAPHTLRAELDAEVETAMAGGLPVFPDALALISAAQHRRIPVALATQSSRRRMASALAAAGLEATFTVEVSSDDAALPKPAPDLYLTACKRLKIPSNQCLAAEDTVVGAKAAQAAGLTVIGINRGKPDAALTSIADVVTHTLCPRQLLSVCSGLPDTRDLLMLLAHPEPSDFGRPARSHPDIRATKRLSVNAAL